MNLRCSLSIPSQGASRRPPDPAPGQQGVHVTDRLAECFTDHRSKSRPEYPVKTLGDQRLMALAMGCEDINDQDRR